MKGRKEEKREKRKASDSG